MISRRDALAIGVSFALTACIVETGMARSHARRNFDRADIVERDVAIDGGNLYIRECGTGVPVIFAHPATGSAHVWDGQLLALASAGFHAMAWSRRGYRGSGGTIQDNQIAGDDLIQLAARLGIGRFHIVGSAAGAGIALEIAVDHPDRVLSLTYACSGSSVADDSLRVGLAAAPSLPERAPEEIELSGEYRAHSPRGLARWLELQRQARPPGSRLGPPPPPRVTSDMLRAMRMPALFIAGALDPFAPPLLLRRLAALVPDAEFLTIPNAGHSAYWERPAQFNQSLISFLRRRRSPQGQS
jgi:pimeloyl-ACP methyl ester carboxylesterase